MDILNFELKTNESDILHIYESKNKLLQYIYKLTGKNCLCYEDDKTLELFRIELNITKDSFSGKRILSFQHLRLVPNRTEPSNYKYRFTNRTLPLTMHFWVRLCVQQNWESCYGELGDNPLSLRYHIKRENIYSKYHEFTITVMDDETPLFIQEARVEIKPNGEILSIEGGVSRIPHDAKLLKGAPLTPALAFQVNKILDQEEEPNFKRLEIEQLKEFMPDVKIHEVSPYDANLIESIKNELNELHKVVQDNWEFVITCPLPNSDICTTKRIALGSIGDRIYFYCNFGIEKGNRKELPAFSKKWNNTQRGKVALVAEGENNLIVFISEIASKILDKGYLASYVKKIQQISDTVSREWEEFKK